MLEPKQQLQHSYERNMIIEMMEWMAHSQLHSNYFPLDSIPGARSKSSWTQGKSTQNLCAVVLTLTHTDTAKRQYFRLAMIAHALCYGTWKLPDVDVSSQTQFVTNIVSRVINRYVFFGVTCMSTAARLDFVCSSHPYIPLHVSCTIIWISMTAQFFCWIIVVEHMFMHNCVVCRKSGFLYSCRNTVCVRAFVCVWPIR